MPEQNEDADTLCVYGSVCGWESACLWEGQGELFLQFRWWLKYLQEARERVSENLQYEGKVFNPRTHSFLFLPQYPAAAGRSVGVVVVKEDVKAITLTQTWVGKLTITKNRLMELYHRGWMDGWMDLSGDSAPPTWRLSLRLTINLLQPFSVT